MPAWLHESYQTRIKIVSLFKIGLTVYVHKFLIAKLSLLQEQKSFKKVTVSQPRPQDITQRQHYFTKLMEDRRR